MDLKTPLSQVSGIGFAYAKRLAYIKIYTVEDLLNHYPFRYEDYSSSANISEAKAGEKVTVKGEVWSIKNVFSRNGKTLTKAIINDGSGSVEIVWFNQSWLTKQIHEGDRLQLSGKIDRYGYKTNLVSPSWEKLPDQLTNTTLRQSSLHTGRLVPIYPETYGVTSKWLRNKIDILLKQVNHKIEDPLPDQIKDSLVDLDEAIYQIHLPESWEKALTAKNRLAFDELFYIQLAAQKKKSDWKNKKVTYPITINQIELDKFTSHLPFKLTNAQNKVIKEITSDLKKTQPMNRLLQGDVGSGKTVVAAAAAFLVNQNKLKTVVMAPTEILAFQHYQTFTNLLSPFGITTGIYTGSRKFTKENHESRQRRAPQAAGIRNQNNPPDVIIGTHALLSEKLILDGVGLVVVDEQQRFGVEQRSVLRNKTNSPHFLTMTATPIPRTVALTLYGDLDLSVIGELPKGRKLVRTHFVPKIKRSGANKFISEQIDKGFQVYIITPLIEEPETPEGSFETEISAKAAKVEYEKLRTTVFKKYRVGLLHGKLKSKEKDQVLNDFKDHKLDILVSTSVVEVGVDVPNATVMVIEGAEKFGLAQLHQLRGRVGRSSEQSFAFLFAQEEIFNNVKRLKNLETIHDGLMLAELDFKIRGSGEIFGTKQSGSWDLKIASLSDLSLIERTRKAAITLLSHSPDLDKYPALKRKLSSLWAKEVMPD